MMKGPSLDAIRKFKQQQEQRKREENERKVQDKLSTLEHRAAQGDKKAKGQLKKIEQVRETNQDNKQSNTIRNDHSGHNGSKQSTIKSTSSGNINKGALGKRKPNNAETDFEELMRMAKSNTNEIKERQKPQEKIVRKIPKQVIETARVRSPDPPRRIPLPNKVAPNQPRIEPRPSTSKNIPDRPPHQHLKAPHQQPKTQSQHLGIPSQNPRAPPQHLRAQPQHLRDPTQNFRTPHQHLKSQPPRAAPGYRPRPPIRRNYDEDDYDDEEEDEYESDGFVVEEDDDGCREELNKTLKSLFNYDRRRGDLREQELDRQYRAIGRVDTFEDLEREERRASRLAAAEDAKAFREEEERKRLKKIRLKSSRD